MTHRINGPGAILAAAAALVAAVGLTACGGSSSTSSTASTTASAAAAATTTPAAAASGTVPVTLTEYKITPAVDSAPAGKVTFDVKNAGQIKHQFTIIKTPKAAATVLSKTNPDDDIPGAKGEISSIPPGATKTLVIKDLKAGHYAIVCALPGHYQSGMYTDFTVR